MRLRLVEMTKGRGYRDYCLSERGADHETETMFVGGGELVIVQAAHILHMDELEDVVNAQRHFHVRPLGVDDIRALGEVHQQRRTSVLFKEGVVLVRQVTPEDAEPDKLAPLEFLQQRDAVQDLTIQVPPDVT